MVETLRKTRSAFATHWARTTFKREFAFITFIVWFFGVHLPHIGLRDATLINAFSPAYSMATTLMWGYIVSAFGADFVAKQLKQPTPTQPGG